MCGVRYSVVIFYVSSGNYSRPRSPFILFQIYKLKETDFLMNKQCSKVITTLTSSIFLVYVCM